MPTFFRDFTAEADELLTNSGWTKVLNLGTPQVVGGKAWIDGLGVNDDGIVTLDETGGATIARVLARYDLSGSGSRAAGAALLCTPASGPNPWDEFDGFWLHSQLVGSGVSTTIGASWKVRSGGLQVTGGSLTLMSAARLGGDTSGIFWYESEVILSPGDAQQRRRFRVRTWKDGELVPEWALDQLIDSTANNLVGPCGIAHWGSRVRYLDFFVESNSPVPPTEPVWIEPVTGSFLYSPISLSWAPSIDANGGLVSYDAEFNLGSGWEPLFSGALATNYNWSDPVGEILVRLRAVDEDDDTSEWVENSFQVSPWQNVESHSGNLWGSCESASGSWAECEGNSGTWIDD